MPFTPTWYNNGIIENMAKLRHFQKFTKLSQKLLALTLDEC
jgi:hypothetical protein